MSGSRFGKLLIVMMSFLAVIGVSSLTASASPSSPRAQKTFAGNAGAQYVRCVPQPAHSCRGPKGPRGYRGLKGKAGAAGTNGSQGPTGNTGPLGPKGTTGTQGTRGVTGAGGTNGTNGSVGSRGTTGSRGPTGTQGTAGSSGVTQYAYVYNTSVETVAVEASVTLDTNGVLTSGFTHTAGTAPITVVGAGVYKVTFSTSGTETSQFALFVDGTLVPGTIYGSGAGTQQNNGQAIFSIAAGGLLTLKNHTSSAAVGLPTIGGGTLANTNASVLIEKLG
jgi:BclA C-terminal domain/Collagen triple helix repeat (20 copies)